jgi:CelD/BcsL family acetyltransferase involved in cellulose biosynthesis
MQPSLTLWWPTRDFYYRTAFKLKFESSLSVGKVLTMQVIRHACESDIVYFDFGQGDAEYKRFWATNSHDVRRAAVGRGLRGYVVVLWFGLIWWLATHQWIRAQYRRIRAKLFGR